MAILTTKFSGDRGDLFQLALKTGALTLATLGLYRFWAKTRLRRWYWSAVRPGGAPLEYTGTGLEKMAGFLMAIIILAMFLGVVNLVAIGVSVSALETAPFALFIAVVASPILLLPLWFFARYRARRYILSRTRWRGIRFGMSPGGWGYAWRACMYRLLTLLSLGLLWPLMTFQLEKYLTKRTWFGTARFSQHGNFTVLFGPILPFLICVWGVIGLSVYGAISTEWVNMAGPGAAEPFYLPQGTVWPFFAALGLILPGIVAAIYYRVASFRVLAALKTLGNGIEFDIYPRTGRLIKIHIGGYMKTYTASGLISTVAAGIVLGVMMLFGTVTPEMVATPPPAAGAGIFLLTWVMLMITYTVFRQFFIVYPMVQHVSETFELHEPALIDTIRQRSHDNKTDAGGFADALDAGAAF